MLGPSVHCSSMHGASPRPTSSLSMETKADHWVGRGGVGLVEKHPPPGPRVPSHLRSGPNLMDGVGARATLQARNKVPEDFRYPARPSLPRPAPHGLSWEQYRTAPTKAHLGRPMQKKEKVKSLKGEDRDLGRKDRLNRSNARWTLFVALPLGRRFLTASLSRPRSSPCSPPQPPRS